MLTIQEFASRLGAIPEEDFTHQRVLDFIRTNAVEPGSLAPYLFFSGERYTRNLIHHTALFELFALCWEPGQTSAIHNHRNQRCWMGVAQGKVQVQNFRVARRDPDTNFCELEPTTRFIIDAATPAEVDPEEPIHLVANPAAFGARAVTLHIYSRPFDRCEVYDFSAKTCREVRLVNTSEFGVLKEGAMAQRASGM